MESPSSSVSLPGGAGAGAPPRLAVDVGEDLLLLGGREEADELVDGRPGRTRCPAPWRRGVAGDLLAVGAQAALRRPARRCLGSSPLSLASTTMLATSRDTSHSNGPGSVSSKSRRSKESCRSGVAQSPKLRMWASPHSCTVRPLSGREARSAAITAAAPVEGPRGRGHPGMADRARGRGGASGPGRRSRPADRSLRCGPSGPVRRAVTARGRRAPRRGVRRSFPGADGKLRRTLRHRLESSHTFDNRHRVVRRRLSRWVDGEAGKETFQGGKLPRFPGRARWPN